VAGQCDRNRGQLGRVGEPVGLPIDSRAPTEIAIAILAEITALRHGIRLALAEEIQPGPQTSLITSYG
jgi:xanthine dehydrogenase accessory factor